MSAPGLRSVAARRAALLVDLGNIRQDQSLQEQAATCYQRAHEIDPQCTAALQNLGYLLFNQGDTERGAEIYERLLTIDRSPINRLLASSVLPIIYDSKNDIQYWRDQQLARLNEMVRTGATVDATKSLVPTCFLAAYQGLNDREVMRLRGQVIRGRDYVALQSATPRPTGRPRVGFLSAYFRDHTIGRLNAPRIRHLDRDRFHVTVILAAQTVDAVTEDFRRSADEFVLLPRGLPQAIQKLRSLELDALVFADVGMDSLCSTLAFSRFAPTQAVTWGHPDTTGSETIDYFLSSRDLEVVDADQHYTERLIRMPTLATLYDRPTRNTERKTRADLGLPNDRHLYACPQTLFKFHPDFDEAIRAILDQDPQGMLVLLDGRVSEWTHRLKRRMRRTIPGFDQRVRFLPAMNRESFLDLLELSDVVLDPFHFGGGNSTLEAVAVGAPTVTLPGQFLRNRISYAIYQQIGMSDLIARTPAEYVSLAVSIATNPDLRRSIREQLLTRSESLFDYPQAINDWNHAICWFAKSMSTNLFGLSSSVLKKVIGTLRQCLLASLRSML